MLSENTISLYNLYLMQPLINKAIKILEKGGVIIYPSDTIWAIGCDATNQEQ